MKGKQLAILLVLVAVLGGAWYFLSERNQATWSASSGAGGKVIDFPINDVARVVIKNASGEVNLVKKGDVWTVQERADYPANFEEVGGLLRKLWELKTVQEVKVGPSQLPRLELVEPGKGDKSGTLVQFLGADGKPVNALLVGKKFVRKNEGGGESDFGGPSDGFPAGRYVKPLNGAKVSLVTETLDDVDPKPERWLLKDFIKVENPKSIALAGTTEPQHWTLSRESASAEWKLADAKPDEKVDSGKTSAFGSIFSSATVNDVLAPDAKPADHGLDKPTTATIETFDGFRYDLQIGKLEGDNYPVQVKVSAELAKARTPGKDEKPEDKTRLDGEFAVKQKQLEEKLAKEKKFEGRVYLIAKFAVDPLMKDRTALLPDKPAEPAKPAPGAAPAASSPAIPPPPKTPVTVTTPPVSIPPPSKPTTPVPAPKPAAPAAAPSTPAPPAPTTPAPGTPQPAAPAKADKP